MEENEEEIDGNGDEQEQCEWELQINVILGKSN